MQRNAEVGLFTKPLRMSFKRKWGHPYPPSPPFSIKSKNTWHYQNKDHMLGRLKKLDDFSPNGCSADG